MAGALVVFAGSLTGIVVLFALKAWEAKRGHRFVPGAREHLDAGALALKKKVNEGEAFLSRLPLIGSFFAYKFLETLTVLFARMARGASDAAHRLADFISHKHNFERKELRSTFIKTMIEHKNGLAQPLSTLPKKRTRRSAKTETLIASHEVHTEVQQ